jgi:hypothetical protein
MSKTRTALLTFEKTALGRILELSAHGRLLVSLEGTTDAVMTCSQLQTAETPVRLAVGDRVLVCLPERAEAGAVVLGRVGPSAEEARRVDLPDELLLEAKNGIVLRVGEGSITIRADGKILIKGKDLVSHAKRMNRIKGGSVSLN